MNHSILIAKLGQDSYEAEFDDSDSDFKDLEHDP